MIKWNKYNVCDSCNLTTTPDKHVDTYTITFERTNKKVKLCEKCLRELLEATKNIIDEIDNVDNGEF